VEVVGVDGWRGGWIAVALRDGSFEAAVVGTFETVLAAFPAAERIGVDIPIGLPPPFPRPADVEAKAFLGRPAPSVFLTFPREVYLAETFAAAVATARSLTGKGIGQHGWRLGPKILEVEPFARRDRGIVEVHPEVSFRALAGQPLAPKKTWTGQAARREALARAGIELPTELADAGRVPADDVLDAAVAAWSALRIASGECGTLPASPPLDGDGRPVAILY
jgi:predicted RNase H-like nuclease